MMKPFFDFFKAPVFPDDEERTRSAYYLNAIVLISILVITLLLVLRLLSGVDLFDPSNLTFAGIIVILIIVFFLGKNNYSRPAGYLLIFTLWVAATVLAINGNGSTGNQAARYIVIIAFSGLILGYKTALEITVISILGLFGRSYAEANGFIHPQAETPLIGSMQSSLPLVLSATFIYLSISSLQNAIKQSKENAEKLEKSNAELKELHGELENKVQERTNNLQKANIENKRRAAQFQTVAQITQKIASEHNLETLLSIITEVISAQFDYYHVAIFLNDDLQEYAILSAASSENGKHMIERAHKIPIGQKGIIGYVAKSGSPRLAKDTRVDEFYFNGADLFETRSELALPLKIGDLVIGVLDVQSKELNAFDQTDIEALTALANQTTIAIQNTRLFAETQTSLAESQLLYGTVVKQTWKTNLQNDPQVGYRYRGVKPIPLEKGFSTPEIRSALENGDVAVTHPSKRKKENVLAVPLKLRGSTIGALNINFPTDVDLGEDEIDIARAASQRIAIALENASLLEESQRRAKREQTITEMSAKISSGTEIETILKTALRELGSHISGAQIMVELGNEEETGQE